MKSKTAYLVLTAFITIALIFVARTPGEAAPYVFLRHTTTSYLIDGASNYRPNRGKMTPPDFRYIYVEVAPFDEAAPKGTLTLNPSGRIAADFYDANDKYVGVTWFSGKREFPIVRHNDNNYYCMVDERDRHGEFYDYSEAYLSRTKFTIALGDVRTEGSFPRLRTTKNQMESKSVPYVELIKEETGVTGLKWRFVDPENSAVAAVRKTTNDVAQVRQIEVFSKKGDTLFSDNINVPISEGEAIEGEVTFTAVKADDIGQVRILFSFDDNSGENVNVEYSWRFYTYAN
ncbi:MAG: hypothetical protein LBQ58_11325 [Synergistaceae bacterium]|nr:hypothetical protein [Synergistaceae bacterium]